MQGGRNPVADAVATTLPGKQGFYCRICLAERDAARVRCRDQIAEATKEVDGTAGLNRPRDDDDEPLVNAAKRAQQREAAIDAAVRRRVHAAFPDDADVLLHLSRSCFLAATFRGDRFPTHAQATHGCTSAQEVSAKLGPPRLAPSINDATAAATRRSAHERAVAANPLLREFSARDAFLCHLARTGIAGQTVEDPFLRRTIDALSRRELLAGSAAPTARSDSVLLSAKRTNEALRALAPRMEKEVLGHLVRDAVVTLAVDSGTVWNRYLATMLVLPKMQAILLDLKTDVDINAMQIAPAGDDDDAPLGVDDSEIKTLTADVMAEHVRGVIAAVEKDYGALVLAVSTDNASSMTSMSRQLCLFDMRCGCHGVQLIVNELFESVEPLRLAWAAAEKFLCEVEALPAQHRQKLCAVRRAVVTRWNGRLALFRSIAKVHTKVLSRQGETPFATPMHHRQQAQVKDAISFLKPFARATKRCESDTADVIDVIAAVGEFVAVQLPAGAMHLLRKRLLSCPLVVVAFFCRCHAADHPQLDALVTMVRAAITSRVSERLLAKHKTTPTVVCGQFDAYQRLGLGRRTTAQYDGRAQFEAEMTALATTHKMGELANWVRAVSRIAASEASAERAFSRLKLSVKPSQKTMLSKTAEARVKLAFLSSFYEEARNGNEVEEVDVDNAVVEVLDDDGDDDTPVDDAAAFFTACNIIIDQAGLRSIEKSTSRTARAHAKPDTKTRCSAVEADGAKVCGRLVKEHKARASEAGTQTTVQDMTLRCYECELYFCATCLGIGQTVAQGAMQEATWRCPQCTMKGTRPFVW